MLRCTADENPENWPHRLPTVMAAYRMTVHRVTGVTPNMAMLGREVLLPASLIARPPVEPANVTVPFVKDLRDVMRDAHERIRQATKKEARTQRKYYDDRSRMTRFYEGQKVWLYWPKPPVRQQFKKLTRLWTGPWKIVLFKSPVVVELRHVSNGATQVVYVDRLLPCVSPSAIGDETDDEPDTDNPPDTPDPAQVPDETVQDVPGLFEDTTLPLSQDSQIMDTQEPDTQFLDSQDPSSQASRRSTRVRKLPASLEPYILG